MAKIRIWHSSFKKFAFRIAFFFQYYVKKGFYILKRRSPQFKRVHINSFPAVHLKRMDVFDFAIKFSSELTVLAAAIMVAGLNIYFFSLTRYNDQSFAAGFLDKHASLNRKLAEKNSTIITTVTPASFIARAQADDFAGLGQQQGLEDAQDGAGAVISESGLVKPSPDSVQGLIDKQIIIYETQSGDTLKSIALDNGVSVQTIKWANGLTADGIKPGWYLIIPPVDGVVAKADSNTTLPDLAAKYNPERWNNNKKVRDEAAARLLESIISYNALADAEDIDTDQIVIIPGGAITSAPTPAPVPRPAVKQPSTVVGGSTETSPLEDDGTGHIFPKGYCTWYVASRIHVPWGGNAKNWPANARAYGALVTMEPAAGSIVVTNDNSRYGHVAIVEQVTDDSILVSEMNYKGFGIVNQRWISRSSKSIKAYIYH